MKKIILAAAATLLVTFGLQAQDVRLKPDHPDTYVVEKGDTLWDISGRFLSQPWYWPEIWQVNPQVENPHLIYPGDRLNLVYVDGQPRLELERGPTAYKLSPASNNRLGPAVRSEPLDTAIPAIPLDAINAFLSRTRIVGPGAFKGVPYVISGQDQRILMGAGEKIYARGDFTQPLPSYGIYRPGPIYADPYTGETLGQQALDVGSVNLRQLDVDNANTNFAVATLDVTRTSRDIRLEDRLLPVEERAIAALFQPSAPQVPVDGIILGVEEGVTQVAKYDVVAINRGLREGLEPGHVLAIYKRGATVRDRLARETVKLPDERAGVLMVFRSFEKMSLGLVLEADKPLEVFDLVRNP
ncbi:LysM peptidoglycan-binding domain-containing protein [Microbulbifer bruguierae]|uniref:LysM peptidoglycan-binding domain-containing protein n=1 Tax=Microbulbifer bruguierae TaxID=3029061 RepID=A0ABY8N8X0_9GAMM|nr:LysM peptidoglycan-binding domain-containing protein [Microbulbifer bruguierae]WGL15338.1 LysM peptidoglycan-binding domain-containing protein [Microbulbifer bruguierae]